MTVGLHRQHNPLVSIVIPTHDRPDYLVLALRSAQAQTHEHIEIIISDNSGNGAARAAVAAQMAADPRIQFYAQEGGGYMDNWLNALGRAKGEYVNFLMDDDLFHPTKVARMLHYFVSFPTVGLVTSFRQLIDADGNDLAPMAGTQRLFEADTVLEGRSFGETILKNGMNLVGEPTTAMYRRADIGAGFGRFCDRQYAVMSDLSTWLELMHGRHCVYIGEALSYFLIHGGKYQRKKSTALNANLEWLQLLMDGHATGKYMLDKGEYRELLAGKLSRMVPFIAGQHSEIRNGPYDVDAIQHLVRRGLDGLFKH